MTNEEHEALIKVRDLLASGALNGQFNMNYAEAIGDCGTVRCIGGWMAHYMTIPNVTGYVNFHSELHDLFHPDDDGGIDWDDITPGQAVLAIDNFLATGKPEWSTILM